MRRGLYVALNGWKFRDYILPKMNENQIFLYVCSFDEKIQTGNGFTHIMFYKERFIRNDFLTSQIFEKF